MNKSARVSVRLTQGKTTGIVIASVAIIFLVIVLMFGRG